MCGVVESALTNKVHNQMNHDSKKTGGEYTCSILHKVAQTLPSNRSMSSWVKFVEQRSLKNADNSTRGLTTLSGSEWRNAIGRSTCIITWLSWLFKFDIVRSLRCTHRETFDAYLSGTLTFFSTLRKFDLSSLDKLQANRFYHLHPCTDAI
jgi:hypothetical protein